MKDHERSGKYDITIGNNKAPITDPKEIEVCELSDKEVRIILKKFSELQECRQLNKIRKQCITK